MRFYVFSGACTVYIAFDEDDTAAGGGGRGGHRSSRDAGHLRSGRRSARHCTTPSPRCVVVSVARGCRGGRWGCRGGRRKRRATARPGRGSVDGTRRGSFDGSARRTSPDMSPAAAAAAAAAPAAARRRRAAGAARATRMAAPAPAPPPGGAAHATRPVAPARRRRRRRAARLVRSAARPSTRASAPAPPRRRRSRRSAGGEAAPAARRAKHQKDPTVSELACFGELALMFVAPRARDGRRRGGDGSSVDRDDYNRVLKSGMLEALQQRANFARCPSSTASIRPLVRVAARARSARPAQSTPTDGRVALSSARAKSSRCANRRSRSLRNGALLVAAWFGALNDVRPRLSASSEASLKIAVGGVPRGEGGVGQQRRRAARLHGPGTSSASGARGGGDAARARDGDGKVEARSARRAATLVPFFAEPPAVARAGLRAYDYVAVRRPSRGALATADIFSPRGGKRCSRSDCRRRLRRRPARGVSTIRTRVGRGGCGWRASARRLRGRISSDAHVYYSHFELLALRGYPPALASTSSPLASASLSRYSVFV